MKNEILDNIENLQTNNNKSISRIIQISIGSVFLFHLIEKSREILPENFFGIEQIKTAGLLIMIITILISILIPTILNKISPRSRIIEILLYSGLILMGIELAFKMTQNLFIFKNRLNEIEYQQIINSAIVISGNGMLIANITIHKLRNKSTLIPILLVLLLIGIWITFNLIMKK